MRYPVAILALAAVFVASPAVAKSNDHKAHHKHASISVVPAHHHKRHAPQRRLDEQDVRLPNTSVGYAAADTPAHFKIVRVIVADPDPRLSPDHAIVVDKEVVVEEAATETELIIDADISESIKAHNERRARDHKLPHTQLHDLKTIVLHVAKF